MAKKIKLIDFCFESNQSKDLNLQKKKLTKIKQCKMQ